MYVCIRKDANIHSYPQLYCGTDQVGVSITTRVRSKNWNWWSECIFATFRIHTYRHCVSRSVRKALFSYSRLKEIIFNQINQIWVAWAWVFYFYFVELSRQIELKNNISKNPALLMKRYYRTDSPVVVKWKLCRGTFLGVNSFPSLLCDKSSAFNSK